MCPIFCLKVKNCEELVPISESWKSRVQRSNDHILRANLLKNPRKKCSWPIIINSDACSGWWNPMVFFSPKSDLVQIQWLNSSSSHHLPVNNGQKLGVNPPLKENTQPAVMVLAIYPRISPKWSYFYMWRVSIIYIYGISWPYMDIYDMWPWDTMMAIYGSIPSIVAAVDSHQFRSWRCTWRKVTTRVSSAKGSWCLVVWSARIARMGIYHMFTMGMDDP